MHQPHHEPVPEERADILKVRPQGALFIVLEAGQTQLRFQHVDRRAFSLYIVNPQLHRVQLHVAEEGDYAGGVQAWVDFQHRTTRRDALREMLDGPTKEMRPETAWLRRRVRGLVP